MKRTDGSQKPVEPAKNAASPPVNTRSITLTDRATSQQYSTNLQYNPYTPGYQDDYYATTTTTQRYSYQQYGNQYNGNQYGDNQYGYNNRQPGTTDSFYARQLAASYDSYNARPQANTNNDSYYARQVAEEYKAFDYAATTATEQWEYQDYGTPAPAYQTTNRTKHQSVERNGYVSSPNQHHPINTLFEEQGYSYGQQAQRNSTGNGNAGYLSPVTQQPGPPKKSVSITAPAIEASPAPSVAASSASKKHKKVNKKSSNLGFSKSFYAGDESFYAVEQHED